MRLKEAIFELYLIASLALPGSAAATTIDDRLTDKDEALLQQGWEAVIIQNWQCVSRINNEFRNKRGPRNSDGTVNLRKLDEMLGQRAYCTAKMNNAYERYREYGGRLYLRQILPPSRNDQTFAY